METLAMVFVIFVGGLMFGFTLGSENMKNEAVKEGKGEYFLDENHQRQWRWK